MTHEIDFDTVENKKIDNESEYLRTTLNMANKIVELQNIVNKMLKQTKKMLEDFK
jgi:hypothetical protein